MHVMDLGSGDGPICHIIADMGYNTVGVDIKPWSYPYKSLAEIIIRDAVECLSMHHDNEVDIFIDGCAVTHFNSNPDAEVPNQGWRSIFKEVHRVMKPTGYFIVTSDVRLEGTDHTGEFISPEQIIQMADACGLALTSEFDYNRDEAIHRAEAGCDLAVANFLFVKK